MKICRWGKEKEPCHGPISPHASFLVNRLVGTVILLVKNCKWGKKKKSRLFFLFPTTSHELQCIFVTRGFTRLSMKSKYVYRALISLYVNFHNNRIWSTMWSTNLLLKICRWGGGRKKSQRAKSFFITITQLQVGGGGGGGGEEKKPDLLSSLFPTRVEIVVLCSDRVD